MQYFQLFFELKGCKREKAEYSEVPPCSCHLHAHVGHAVFTNETQEKSHGSIATTYGMENMLLHI